MLHTGLTSVTFRALSPDDIIGLAHAAGLESIEWGGDVHVPPGELERAEDVAAKTTKAGLRISSYGSYYKVGGGANNLPFERVLETALALHAPVIRVWAGDLGSGVASADWWQAVIADATRIAQLAAEKNIVVAFEYHENTLADTPDAVARLISTANGPNLKCYWQMLNDQTVDQYEQELKSVSPWLANVHVFYEHGTERLPLAEGRADWLRLLQIANRLPGERYCLLEFVRDDSQEQFFKDAEILRKIVEEVR